MPRRKLRFVEGCFYHIYNHAASRQNLAEDDCDFNKIHELMTMYAHEYNLSVPAWCLMPNHFHWLVYQWGEYSTMHLPGTVFNVYSRWFNTKYGLRGTLLEGRFKVKPVTDIRYLKHLCLYIHSNPVKANLCPTPEDWLWSNLEQFASGDYPPIIEPLMPGPAVYIRQLHRYCKIPPDDSISE